MKEAMYDDPAHDEEMRQLRREQLEADISLEEAEEELGWHDNCSDDDYYHYSD